MTDPVPDSNSDATPEQPTTTGGGVRSSTPKWIAALAAVAVIAVIAAGAGWFAADRSTEDLGEPVADEAGVGAPGRLYVQRAGAGASNVDGTGAGTLTLTQVDADTVWFQDRPGRASGRTTTADFVDGWASVGFADDPPNAALEISTPGGPSASHVLELSNPHSDDANATITYDVQLATDEVLPAEFEAASLFIDDGGASGASTTLQLQFDDVAPGQELALELAAPDGGQVAFASTPGFGTSSSGLQIESSSGVLPVTQLDLSAARLVIDTSGGETGGGSMSFSIELYLVAPAAPEAVSLTSSSDPGVEITAALGDMQPEVVNSSATLFAWPG